MPSVHYKFKSSLDYKTVMFEGIQISVGDLKKLIYENEKIGKSADFDLQITNAQTKQVYEDDSSPVQRNASVVVARVPTAVQQKLPKVWDTRTEGKVNRNPTVFQPVRSASSMFPGNDLASKTDLSEDEKLKLMQHEATQDYDPSQYQKGRQITSRGPAPATLRCNKCGVIGDHWIKDCPLHNVRRPTGIPKDELMETTPDDPQAMLTPGGKYVVPIMDKQAHLIGKKERPPFFDEQTPIVEPQPKNEIPASLKCMLCEDLLREAVLIKCCGKSFCDDCIRTRLLESEYHECPNCSEKGVSPDSLVPNSHLREAVTDFRSNETGYVYSKRQNAFGGSNFVTQPSTAPSSKLKINLVSAGIARANAAEQKLRAGSIAADVTSSPSQQMAMGSTQSPDVRDRDSPAVGTGTTLPNATSSANSTFSTGLIGVSAHSSTSNRATPPSSAIPAVRIVPSAPPTAWPSISLPASITTMAPIPSMHMSTAPPVLPNFPPNVLPAVAVTGPPLMRFPPQPHMTMLGPPGVQPAAPMPYPTPANPFMATQPPPPGVPPAISNMPPGPVVTAAYVHPRGPSFLPPRRPLTEAEFYDAKRRMLESRFRERHRSPRPQDAWEEFLARKDRKRRRSSTRSSRSSSRSRSRSSGRSRHSRSRSITHSRSRSRSPSYHSRRRKRRERSRSRGRSRSRTPRSQSRRYNRRVRRPMRSHSRNRNKASPSNSRSAKRSPPRQRRYSGDHGSSSRRRQQAADLPVSQTPSNTSDATVDKRSSLASTVGHAPSSRSRQRSPSHSPAPQSTNDRVVVESMDAVSGSDEKSTKERKMAEPMKEEKSTKAKDDKSSSKEERHKKAKDEKRSKESKSAKEPKKDKEKEEAEAVTNADNRALIEESEKPIQEAKEEPSESIQETVEVVAKEASVPKDESALEDEGVEKKKKAKKEKKKKRKHHRHKSSKTKTSDEEGERKSKDKEKEYSKKERSSSKEKPTSKVEKSAKASSEEKSEKKRSSEEKGEKKEKRHKSHHKKEKRKSEDGSASAQSELPSKKKRRE